MLQLKRKLRLNLLRTSQGIESLVTGFCLQDEPTPLAAEIIQDLDTEGVHVTTLDRLAPLWASNALEKAADFIAARAGTRGAGLWKRSAASNDLIAQALLDELPELYLLGLDEALLGLVQRYLRLPIAYHGAVLRHSSVDGRTVGPKLWHRDAEDFHVFRMIIYLNDVTMGSGPFEYIPRSASTSIRRKVAAAGGVISNDQMMEFLPRERWKRCTGPMGTVILCDTAQVYHHELLQTERDRFVVMIGYSSRRPKNRELSMAHFPVEQLESSLLEIVEPKYREHVFAWRREAV